MAETEPVDSEQNKTAKQVSLAVADYREGCPPPGVAMTSCGTQMCMYSGESVPNLEYYNTIKHGCEKSGRTPHWTMCPADDCACMLSADTFDTNGTFACVETTSHDLVSASTVLLPDSITDLLVAAADPDDDVHWLNRIPGLIPIAIFLYVFAICYGIGYFIRDNRKLFMNKTRKVFFGLGFVFFPFMFVIPGLAPPEDAKQYF